MAHNLTESREAIASREQATINLIQRNRQSAIVLLLWAVIVLGFFTLSNRQEYYTPPCSPGTRSDDRRPSSPAPNAPHPGRRK